MDAEVGVVGAGPAGARAAELLARAGAGVLLWDRSAPWEKPCGGGLPASAFRHFPELAEIRPLAREIRAVRFQAATETGFPVSLDRPMYMISRRELGRWQLDRARGTGARFVGRAIRSIDRSEEGWRLDDGTGRTWCVSLLVGADGAASLVRRVAAPDLRVELAPTRVCYPRGAGLRPGTVLVRLYDEVEGYFWDFARPDHRSVGVGTGPGGWNRPRMDREIDTYGSWPGDGGEDRPDRTGAVIGTAQLGHGDYAELGGARYALLGDAAGFADPATGEGIQNALRSATLLADAYEADGDFRSYPGRARNAMDAEFRASRLLRKALFELGAGPWLVRRGRHAAWAYALVSAVMNATNEHDVGLWSLLRRSLRTLRTGARPSEGNEHPPERGGGNGDVVAEDRSRRGNG